MQAVDGAHLDRARAQHHPALGFGELFAPLFSDLAAQLHVRAQIVRAPVEFTSTVMGVGEMQIIDLMYHNRDALLALWGVPLSQLGGTAAFIDAEWPNFSGVARAVLQSMRDQPSEAMIAALRPMTDATIGPGRFEIEAVIRDWRILIDAALKEGE